MPFSALFYLRAMAKSVGKKDYLIMGKYKMTLQLITDFKPLIIHSVMYWRAFSQYLRNDWRACT